MKNLKWTAVLGIMLLGAPAFGGEQQVLNTQKEKENYSTGVEIVRNLKQQGGAVDLDLVIQGIRDGLTGEKLLMTEAEIRTTVAARQNGKAGQREGMKADSGTGIVPSPMSAGRENAPAAPQKEEHALPRTDQAEQNEQLASQVQQGQSVPNPQNIQSAQLAPNGTVLSRRNQAKLSVKEMKAGVRARAFSGDIP